MFLQNSRMTLLFNFVRIGFAHSDFMRRIVIEASPHRCEFKPAIQTLHRLWTVRKMH